MDLRVEQLPLPVDRSLYQEAIDTYLELSHKYIAALYVFGNIHYPGLSDLDLLVVPTNSYVAPLGLHLVDRLPRRFYPIIEHEVFIVPESHLRAYSYRWSPTLSLAYGRDVLAGITRETSVAARVTQVLEDTNNMLGYLAQLERAGVLKARSCMRVFNSQRYKAGRLIDLGLTRDDGYGATIDALRDRFMITPDAACVLEMFRVFRESVTAGARALESSLGLDVRPFGPIASVVHGQVPVPFLGFELEDAKCRARLITSYRQELVRRNYWYGFWFLPRLFPAAAATPPWHRGVFRTLRSGSRRWRRLRSSLGPREV
jgi:hypothetical protein